MSDTDKKPRKEHKRRATPIQPQCRSDELDYETMNVRELGDELGVSAAWASMMLKKTMTRLAAVTIEGMTGEKPTLNAAKTLAVHPEFQNLVVKLLKEKDSLKDRSDK
jgi:hypothetical protein